MECVTESPTFDIESDRPTHHCGVGIVYSFDGPGFGREDMYQVAYEGMMGVQHRGQNGGGVVILHDNCSTQVFRSTSKVHEIWSDISFPQDSGSQRAILFHTRYGTSGGYADGNLQPIEACTSQGEKIFVAVNGNLPFLYDRYSGDYPSGVSDTYIAAQMLAGMQGDDWDTKILQFSKIPDVAHGANNMVVVVGNSVYVMRDKYGLHPLVIGEKSNTIAIVSETTSLQRMGYEVVSEFPPGQIMKLTQNGAVLLQEGNYDYASQCIFEPVYFSHVNHRYPTHPEHFSSPEEWHSTMRARQRCGEVVAREQPVEADMIVGMADSGLPFAFGYSNQSSIPYVPGLTRDHYAGNGTRTFMHDQHLQTIQRLVHGKFMPVPDRGLWKGKSVIVCDDSIVRGNTSRVITQMLREELDVAEIHWRFGYPMITHPCPLGVSFRSQDELIAYRAGGDPKIIANMIGADSVGFISDHGLIGAVKAIGLNPYEYVRKNIYFVHGFCGGCVTGEFPHVHQ